MNRLRKKTLALLAIPLAGTLALSGCFSAAAEQAGSTGRISVAHMQPPRSGLSPLSDDAFKLSRWSAAETMVTLDESGDVCDYEAAIGAHAHHTELRMQGGERIVGHFRPGGR